MLLLACCTHSLCAIPPALPLSPFLGQLREAYGTKKYVPTDLRPKRTRAIRRRLSKREVRQSTLFQLRVVVVASACAHHILSSVLVCVYVLSGHCQDREAGPEGQQLPTAPLRSQGISISSVHSRCSISSNQKQQQCVRQLVGSMFQLCGVTAVPVMPLW